MSVPLHRLLFAALVGAALSTSAGTVPVACAESAGGVGRELPETIRWPSAAGEVVFAHRFHAEEAGADCASCHHETVAASLDVPHPSYFDDFWVECSTCHTGRQGAAVQRCASCHPRRASGPNVELPTTKVAIHRSCWSCHEPGRGAEASGECAVCHQRPAPPPHLAAESSPAAAK